MYFAFYILVLLVLPRQLTITLCVSFQLQLALNQKCISGFVCVRHAARGMLQERNPHVNDLQHTLDFKKVSTLFNSEELLIISLIQNTL